MPQSQGRMICLCGHVILRDVDDRLSAPSAMACSAAASCAFDMRFMDALNGRVVRLSPHVPAYKVVYLAGRRCLVSLRPGRLRK